MQSERLLSAPAPEATVSNWPPPPPPCDKHGSLVAESSLVASVAASAASAGAGAVSCGMTTRRASSPAAFVDGAPGPLPPWLRENGGGGRNGGDGKGGGGGEGSGGDGDGRDGRESPGSLPSSSSSFSLSSCSVVSCPPTSRAKLAGGRDGGRLAWCGDQRLLPRPSATLQLRRHNPSSSGPSLGGTTSASQSTTAAAYLGRLNLSADSSVAGGGVERGGDGAAWGGLGQLPVNGGWGDTSLDGGLGYVRAAPAAAAEGGGDGSGVGRDGGAGGGVGGANGTAGGGYSADDAVTLSSSGLSVTSGEESDGDEVFMEVDDRDDPNFDYGALEDDDLSPADASSTGVGSESAEAGARTEAGTAAEAGSVAVTAGGDLIAEGGAGAVAGVVAAVAGTAAGGGGLRDGSASAVAAGGGHPPSRGMGPRGKGKGKKRCAKKTTKISDGVAPEPVATCEADGDGGVGGGEVAAVGVDGVDAKQAPIRPRPRRAAKGPVVPKQPPSGPRKWPPRPRHRALVYAAAAEASRRVRGFTGWVFPALPPPPPPRPRPPTPPPPVVEEEEEAEPPAAEETEEGEGSNTECGAEGKAGRVKELSRKEKIKQREKNMFLGFAKDNPPGKPSPNEFGWLPIDPMLTREGRAAAKKRALERRRAALERIAERKRQEILEALRIKVHDVCAPR